VVGGNLEIPFELLVVFATNLPLSDLAEDAFMRRSKNKIKIESLSRDLFSELLRRVCEDEQLPLYCGNGGVRFARMFKTICRGAPRLLPHRPDEDHFGG
jgi:hypothetical protein